MSAIVFLDTETTGLDLRRNEVWEFAAIRREADGTEREFHTFVRHNRMKVDLPEPFLSDYKARYDHDAALDGWKFTEFLVPIFAGRPHIVGAVPDFDIYRIERKMFLEAAILEGEGYPWHYHLIDIESMAVGYLRNLKTDFPLPWDSDKISAALGVTPPSAERHTAMGDVRWVRDMWNAMDPFYVKKAA